MTCVNMDWVNDRSWILWFLILFLFSFYNEDLKKRMYVYEYWIENAKKQKIFYTVEPRYNKNLGTIKITLLYIRFLVISG